MSETTELIMAGIMCQMCGQWMDDIADPDFVEPGYPRTCEDCGGDE